MSVLYLKQAIGDNWNMSQELRSRIALNVNRLRTLRGYQREELSLMLGVDNSYISKLEKARINITIDKLEQIAILLNVDPSELLL